MYSSSEGVLKTHTQTHTHTHTNGQRDIGQESRDFSQMNRHKIENQQNELLHNKKINKRRMGGREKRYEET